MILSSIIRSVSLTLKSIFLTESVVAAVIIGNSLLLFAMGYDQVNQETLIHTIDHAFTIFFIIEVLVKVREYGWKGYITNAGNKFDFILVAISAPSLLEIFITVPDISYLLVFRLLRVIRILRFMRFIPNLAKMLQGIRRAFRASIFIIAALFIYNVLLGILSNHIFKTYSPELFGNPLLSLYSVFTIFTVEGWHEVPDAIAQGAGPDTLIASFARLYFLIIVLTGGILGFSLVNAIFVDEMTMDNNQELENKVDELNRKVDELLKQQQG